jgi:hypothetical protein
MKSRFVQVYLGFVAVVLSLTALAKLPAIFPRETLCMYQPLFGDSQPVSNEVILGTAAAIELFIVGLICFRTPRWLPCLASTVWGSICFAARAYFITSGIECGCLGWLARPGPMTNTIAGLLALALAVGGMIALDITSRDAKWRQNFGSTVKNSADSDGQRSKMETAARIILIVGASACFVVGLNWMYWTIARPASGALPIAVFAFIPIILIAPRSKILKRPLFFISLGVIETIVIACGLTFELR